MSDVVHADHAITGTTPAARLRPWPAAPYLVALLAGSAGLVAGRAMGGETTGFEDKLLLLLRFMAAMKFAGVVVAAGVLHWRLTQTIAWRLAGAYAAALAAMGIAAGMIWSLGGIAPAAVLFHIGLLGFLILAWRDDGVRLPVRR